MSEILQQQENQSLVDPIVEGSLEKEAQTLEEGESMILEEDLDSNYEPSEQEIRDYAKYIGMDLDLDQDLFWLARDGLKEPLQAPWKPCQTKKKEIYFFNFTTGESQWEHPVDNIYKEKYQKEKAAKQERALLENLNAHEEKDD